jgi:DNA-binding Lrp family transcriptional regulator
VDAVDIAIIRAMGLRPSGSAPKPLDALQPSRIARTTGLALNTVKERIQRLTERGVIQGYTAVPNLRHLDLEAAAVYVEFATDEAKENAVQRIRALDGLLELNDFMGRGLCADLGYRGDADRREKHGLLTECAGGSPVLEFYAWDAPPVTRTLTRLDWRIIQALRADPRASAAQLAARVGVSARTVKRHLARMADEGSIFLAPVVDPSRADGLFIFAILVYLEDGASEVPLRGLRQEFRDELVHAFVPRSVELGHLDILLFARTSAEVEAMRRRAQAVPGVRRAEAWLYRAFEGVGPWLDAAIERAAQVAPQGVPSGAGVSPSRRPSAAAARPSAQALPLPPSPRRG